MRVHFRFNPLHSPFIQTMLDIYFVHLQINGCTRVEIAAVCVRMQLREEECTNPNAPISVELFHPDVPIYRANNK